jgi:toxin HigB-1
MIKTFQGKQTEKVFLREAPPMRSRDVYGMALRKLMLLDASEKLEDLRMPAGNQLKKLVGDRNGQYSIRINDQWRLCFRWEEGDAYEVEIVDHH